MELQKLATPKMKGNLPHRESYKVSNGASGAAWAAVASSLVDMMYEAGYGVEIWTAISNKAIHILSFGFVDDYNLLVASRPEDQSLDDLVERAQETLTGPLE